MNFNEEEWRCVRTPENPCGGNIKWDYEAEKHIINWGYYLVDLVDFWNNMTLCDERQKIWNDSEQIVRSKFNMAKPAISKRQSLFSIVKHGSEHVMVWVRMGAVEDNNLQMDVP